MDATWKPKMDCLVDLQSVIQNESIANLSIAARSSFLCKFDKNSIWIPEARHSNGAEEANAIFK